MIKKYRAGASAGEIEDSTDVSFSEFVQDILEHQRDSQDGTVATVSWRI